MDLTRYLPANDDAGRLALWCTDCAPDPTTDPPFWTEDDAAEQVTELCLANLVGIAKQHEREHHADNPAPAAPAPNGSYWTDPDGKVWDLSKDYEDRDGDRWRVVVEPTLGMESGSVYDTLSQVERSFGPLTPVMPKPETATDKPCHCYPRCAAEG